MKKTNFYLGETKDYSKFNFRDANRDINKNNLTKIQNSIENIGLQCPIIVDEDYNIIDGQHRFVVLVGLSMVIPYIVSSKGTKDSDLSKLQESRKWTALDHCNSLAAQGDYDCNIVLEAIEYFSDRKFTEQTILELYMKGGSSGLLSKLKDKKYKVDVDVALYLIEAIDLMAEYPMGCSPYTQKVCRSIKTLYNNNNGLNLDAIKYMVDKNYIKSYSNEGDMTNSMQDMYDKALKAIK